MIFLSYKSLGWFIQTKIEDRDEIKKPESQNTEPCLKLPRCPSYSTTTGPKDSAFTFVGFERR